MRASIKPNIVGRRPNVPCASQRDGLRWKTISLKKVMLNARTEFPMTRNTRSTGRTSSPHEHFNIDATFPADTPPPQVRLMLQSLLGDRFKLVLHKETRQLPMYSLVLAKGGTEDPRCRKRRYTNNRQASTPRSDGEDP